jgi:uncharacterized protein (TIGR04255 family)
MHFPETPRVSYEKDTLAEVICQVRFPPILAIGTKPPDDFQERIRDRYPAYRKQGPLAAPPEIAGFVAEIGVGPGPELVTHWFEQGQEGPLAISLGTQFVAVTARVYPGWEAMHTEIERAVDALQAAYAPAFYQRVGLRYRDVLDRQALGLADKDWADLLHPAMVSLLGADLGIDPSRDRVGTEAILHLDSPEVGRLRLRHGIGLNGGQHTYELDADFYADDLRIQREEVFELLAKFHDQEGHLFRWAVGNDLRTALGPLPEQ